MGRSQNFVIASVLCAVGLFPLLVKAEPVVVIVKVIAAEGHESEVQDRNLKLLQFLRETEPPATFRLYRSMKSPTTFLWYEVFQSKADHETHLKDVMPRFRKEFGPAPKGLMAKRPEVESYIELTQ